MVETAHAQWKIAKIDKKRDRTTKISTSYENFCLRAYTTLTLTLTLETDVAESISSDRFTIGSRINALTGSDCTCADIVMFETHGIGQTPSSLADTAHSGHLSFSKRRTAVDCTVVNGMIKELLQIINRWMKSVLFLHIVVTYSH